MSIAKKRRPYQYSGIGQETEKQEGLRQVKIEAEKLTEKLQRSILDNPRLAKKSALLISLWVQGKTAKKS